LVAEAHRQGVPVLQGVHPHPELAEECFEWVTCADVIEHVTDPVSLLRGLAASVQPGGTVVVTTPDVESLARRVFGKRWWHFRTAHVCFFPTSAMNEALMLSGLRCVERVRQKWTFSVGYLGVRAAGMVAGSRAREALAPIERSRRLAKVRVPVDLRDSWVYVCERV
ncbi:MAG: class I SAM-dependent methyltransferase, partial [Myxococcota bacterium]